MWAVGGPGAGAADDRAAHALPPGPRPRQSDDEEVSGAAP